jgi:hypothetical protein
MASSPAQRAFDQAQAVASMRHFYASLGMREETLERAMQRVGMPTKPAGRGAKQHPRPARSAAK